MTNVFRKEDALIAQLKGELDHHNAPEIREAIDAEIAEECPLKLIFDLSDVTFMDSSGIGIIMGRYRKIQEQGGVVRFVGINPKIDKLMKVSGLLKIIPEFEDVNQALAQEEVAT